MYHTHAYLDFILNPAHSAESEPTGNNTDPEFEALKTEFGLEDVISYANRSRIRS